MISSTKGFNTIYNTFKKILEGNLGNKQSINLAEQSSYIKITSDQNRLIVSYSMNEDFDFFVSGFDDNDWRFQLNINSGDIQDIKIILLNSDGSIPAPEFWIEPYIEMPNIILPEDISFSGNMAVFLYCYEEIVGKIWISYSNTLIYSCNENQKYIIDNIGVLLKQNKKLYIEKNNLISINSDYISLKNYIIFSKSSSSLDLTDFLKKIEIESLGKTLQQPIEKVYNLRLQFFSNQEYLNYWIKYYADNNNDFLKEQSNNNFDDTIKYIPSENGIWLNLISSIIEIKI
jgi:hypothetical protein